MEFNTGIVTLTFTVVFKVEFDEVVLVVTFDEVVLDVEFTALTF